MSVTKPLEWALHIACEHLVGRIALAIPVYRLAISVCLSTFWLKFQVEVLLISMVTLTLVCRFSRSNCRQSGYTVFSGFLFLAHQCTKCKVSFCDRSPSVVVFVRPFIFSYKWLLLLHQLTKFKIILQKCSLGGSLLNLFKKFYSMQNFGCHGNKKGEINQNLKNLLVWK